MFCKKCGNQLNAVDKFCNHCGEPNGEPAVSGKAPEDNLSGPQQQGTNEPNTGEVFAEQLRALTKTGAKGIKEAAAQAQTKAGEFSKSIEKSQSLKQLGEKKNLFLFVCGALAINLVLLLSKTIYFEMRYFGEGAYSVIGFCSLMLELINEYGRYADGATDAPLYLAIKYLEIIGIIFTLTAVIKTVLPLFTSSEDKSLSFKLIRTAAICSIALTFLFMIFCTIGLSSQTGIEVHLTLSGWLYVVVSVALIVSALKLSPIEKKKNT